MVPAVTQLLVVQVGLFRPLVGQLLNTRDLLTLPLGLLNPLEQLLSRLGLFVQVIVQLPRHKIHDKTPHSRPVRRHIDRTELRLRLRFKHRLFYADAQRANDSRVHILDVEVFSVKITQRFSDRLPKILQVGPALRRVLPVDERVVLFAVLIPVRQAPPRCPPP
jgi:hypothetical protein